MFFCRYNGEGGYDTGMRRVDHCHKRRGVRTIQWLSTNLEPVVGKAVPDYDFDVSDCSTEQKRQFVNHMYAMYSACTGVRFSNRKVEILNDDSPGILILRGSTWLHPMIHRYLRDPDEVARIASMYTCNMIIIRRYLLIILWKTI